MSIKTFTKRLLRKLFELGQRLGLNILPIHFYSETPNIHALRQSQNWRKPGSMNGIVGREIESQFSFMESCCLAVSTEAFSSKHVYMTACSLNGKEGYGAIEAEFLYYFICKKRPRRIVQIGCGVSTAVLLMAAEEATYAPEIICIDPFPTEYLIEEAKKGRIRLIAEPAQDVAFDELTNLGEKGLLFVDSTHTVKPGSEVNRIVLEVLPILKTGQFVHFHDIYFPYDYNRKLLTEGLCFPNESTLLQSFLIHNLRYRLRLSLSMLHYAQPLRLKKCFPSYNPAPHESGLEIPGETGHFPSSAYLEVVDQSST